MTDVARDARALERALGERVGGGVRFDDAARAMYSTDASNYRQVPIGVVFPRSQEELVAAVEVCRSFDAPVLPRGAGTSLAGQTCNAAVVLDCSRHLTRFSIDPDRRTARVEPGVILDHLRSAARAYGLTFGPDPATHDRCTLGGMIGNNSCGIRSVSTGKTVDNVATLDVLTYDGVTMTVGPTTDEDRARLVATGGRIGAIYSQLEGLRDAHADAVRTRFPSIPRRVSGYNLDQLLPENGFDVARALVGSEGTCVTLLESTVHLVDEPAATALVVAGYDDVVAAAEDVPFLLGFAPIGLEGIDDVLVRGARARAWYRPGTELLPEGNAWLLAIVGGDSQAEARDRARALADAARNRGSGSVAVYDDARDEHLVWRVREAALGVTSRAPDGRERWEGWEDAAVAPERLADYLRDLRALISRFGYDAALYGHFGDGCVHTRIDFDFETTEGVARFRAFIEQAVDIVVARGGSISGEHGDGQARAEFLGKMFGPDLVDAFRRFKAIWDPGGRMNPGKLVDPYRIDENVRLLGRKPVATPTHFAFADDDGDPARAALRCVGVGLCRRTSGGTMCPSYMATLDEEHSTRGRARLLYEALGGGSLADGWRSDEVREALDLCLSCKACKTECPVGVDMATYKAEFLSHYYDGKRRPRAMLAMAFARRWIRVGARMPTLANGTTSSRTLGSLLKRAAGIAPQRRVPALARRAFHHTFSADRSNGRRVILWPDTFSDHLRPSSAEAAVEVLRASGYRVELPSRPACCGRPLYDAGMLDRAKATLREVIDVLRPALRDGTPIVVLEPSCLSVFRDEAVELLPGDDDARALASSAISLGELLARDGSLPSAGEHSGEALLQPHCHQRALSGIDHDRAVLEAAGYRVSVVPPGCCGMAGSFGFDRDKYDVSMAVGELAVLPAVRAASADAIIVSDGFSCREQIEHATDRIPVTLAEALRDALRARGHLQGGSKKGGSPVGH